MNNVMTARKDQRLEGVSILVVDDEKDARDMLHAFFKNYGASVRTSPNAGDAYGALQGWQPDIIVSDIAMRDEDGVAFMKMVRSREQERGGQIPAVAITGYTQDVHRWQALHAGFQAYLAKPLNLPDLLDVVVRLAKE